MKRLMDHAPILIILTTIAVYVGAAFALAPADRVKLEGGTFKATLAGEAVVCSRVSHASGGGGFLCVTP